MKFAKKRRIEEHDETATSTGPHILYKLLLRPAVYSDGIVLSGWIPSVTLYSTVVTIVTIYFNIKELCPHSLFMCSV